MNQQREKPPRMHSVDGNETYAASQGSGPPVFAAVSSNPGYRFEQPLAQTSGTPIGLPYGMVSWDQVNASCFAFPSSYGHPTPLIPPPPPAKCTECIILGCELQHTRNCLREMSMKLVMKGSELSHCESELEYLTKKNEKLEEELKQLRGSCSDLTIKHEKLEEELKQSKGSCSDLKERCHHLESVEKILEQKLEELQTSKRDIFESHLKISTPDISKCNDALSDTYNSPWKQDSSSKPHNAAGNQPVKSERTSQPYEDTSGRRSTGSSRRPYENKSSSNTDVHSGGSGRAEGGTKQSQNSDVYPERHQNEHHENKQWQNTNIRPARNQSRGDPPKAGTSHGSTDVHANRAQNKSGYIEGPSQGTRTALPSSSLQKSKTSENKPQNCSNCVKEIKSDLFEMPCEYALAHCVGSDFLMSSGVAVKFRKTFTSVPELLDQNKNPGEVAVLQKSDRYIYYLVTKPVSTVKPKWEDFEKSVIEWSHLCVKHGVRKIAVPKIGCGRDQLDWNRVQTLLNRQFLGTGIEIAVCVIDEESAPEKKWNLKLFHSKEPLVELDSRDCALLFMGSKDGVLTDHIDKLASKYGFTSDYSGRQHGSCSLYHYENQVRNANVFGLVVKEHHEDSISFCSVARCLQDLKRVMKKLGLWYIGIQAFDDPKYDLVMRKIWTVIINSLFIDKFEVYFCWPGNTKEMCWEEAK